MRRLATTLALAFTLTSIAGAARADDCMGTSVRHIRATGAPASVEVAWNDARDRWELKDGARARALAAIPEHAHLEVFVASDGKVAVVRTSAGHDLDDRVLIYDRRGRLQARHGLRALFGTDPLSVVERSISHMQWYRGGRFTGSHTVEIALANGQNVSVDLAP